MPTTTSIVYGYADPRTDVLRYVGKSSTGLTRPQQFGSHSGRCLNWIKSLAVAGLKPTVVVLEDLGPQVTMVQLNDAERRCIAYARTCLGADLTNLTDGGDGPMVGRKHTVEAKARISAANKVSMLGNQNRRGTSQTDAAKAKISTSKIGKPRSVETRAKIAAGHRGKPLSAETREKLSAVRKGRKQSAEHIANRVASRQRNKLKNKGEV
jgi:hypothetical protein